MTIMSYYIIKLQSTLWAVTVNPPLGHVWHRPESVEKPSQWFLIPRSLSRVFAYVLVSLVSALTHWSERSNTIVKWFKVCDLYLPSVLLLFSQNKCLCLAWIPADHYCIAQKLDQNYDTIRPKMLKDPQWQTQTKGKFKRFVHLQKRRVPLWHHKSILRGFMRGVKGPACALSIDLLLHLHQNYCWRHYFPIYTKFPKFTLTSNAHSKKWPGHHSMINHYHFKMVRAFSTSPPTVDLSRGSISSYSIQILRHHLWFLLSKVR